MARPTSISHRRFRQFRASYLRRNPYCALCEQAGKRAVPAVELDHIVPRAEGGSIWDEANCQGVCVACHRPKTKKDLRRMAAQKKQGKSLPCPHGIPIRYDCEECKNG